MAWSASRSLWGSQWLERTGLGAAGQGTPIGKGGQERPGTHLFLWVQVQDGVMTNAGWLVLLPGFSGGFGGSEGLGAMGQGTPSGKGGQEKAVVKCLYSVHEHVFPFVLVLFVEKSIFSSKEIL